jgi:sugar phosphate isomerase/epimerase
MSAKDMLAFAADHGVRLTCLDSLTGWTPIRVPRDAAQDLREMYDVPIDESFAIVDALELNSIMAVAGYDKDAVPLPVLIEGFGKLCDRAAKQGIQVDVEFMPFWGMPDLASAWAIVGGAARDNSGIVVDTWHFAKGNYDLDLLRSLPGKYLTGVQVADGLKRQRGLTLQDDTLRYREFPGEGELPLIETLKIIKDKRHLRHIGPEVFSDEADKLSPEQAGKKSGDTTRRVLKAAGISFGEQHIG